MTALKSLFCVLALSYILMMFTDPALCISVSYGTNGASSSSNYQLDSFTTLNEVGILGEGTISRTSKVSGSGNNELSYQASANGACANGAVKSSGVLSATTSTIASGEVAALSQDVAGSGDIVAAVQGTFASKFTEQASAGLNGRTTTSMNAFAGEGASTSGQSTTISSDAGATSSISNSAENNAVVVGVFSGSGDLNAELTSIAADRAGIYGTNSFNGQEVVNNDVLQTVADGKLSVSVDGIYDDRKGDLGNFGVTASNTLTSSQNNVAFETAGWAWAAPIHYKLSTNLIGSSTCSANAKLWAREISKGANTWDLNTKKNVFKCHDTTNTARSANVLEFTTNLPTVGAYQGGTGDGNNNYLAVTTELASPIIAETWTWYYDTLYVTGWDGDPYNKAAESDVYFNANMAWRVATAESTATNSKFDVRTIATHEVGHSLGLDDLYQSKDSNKIMYGINNGQVKWYLRNADKLGLWSLYGP